MVKVFVVIVFVLSVVGGETADAYHGHGGYQGHGGYGYLGYISTPVCVKGNVEDEKDPAWRPFWVDGSRILGVPPGLWKCTIRPTVAVPWWQQTFP